MSKFRTERLKYNVFKKMKLENIKFKITCIQKYKFKNQTFKISRVKSIFMTKS